MAKKKKTNKVKEKGEELTKMTFPKQDKPELSTIEKLTILKEKEQALIDAKPLEEIVTEKDSIIIEPILPEELPEKEQYILELREYFKTRNPESFVANHHQVGLIYRASKFFFDITINKHCKSQLIQAYIKLEKYIQSC